LKRVVSITNVIQNNLNETQLIIWLKLIDRSVLGARDTTRHCRSTMLVVILSEDNVGRQRGPTADTRPRHGMAC